MTHNVHAAGWIDVIILTCVVSYCHMYGKISKICTSYCTIVLSCFQSHWKRHKSQCLTKQSILRNKKKFMCTRCEWLPHQQKCEQHWKYLKGRYFVKTGTLFHIICWVQSQTLLLISVFYANVNCTLSYTDVQVNQSLSLS